MTDQSTFADLGRTRKAIALADLLAGAGFSYSQVAAFDAGQWRQAQDALDASAHEDGQPQRKRKPPSEITQALVVKLMRDRARRALAAPEERFGVTAWLQEQRELGRDE